VNQPIVISDDDTDDGGDDDMQQGDDDGNNNDDNDDGGDDDMQQGDDNALLLPQPAVAPLNPQLVAGPVDVDNNNGANDDDDEGDDNDEGDEGDDNDEGDEGDDDDEGDEGDDDDDNDIQQDDDDDGGNNGRRIDTNNQDQMFNYADRMVVPNNQDVPYPNPVEPDQQINRHGEIENILVSRPNLRHGTHVECMNCIALTHNNERCKRVVCIGTKLCPQHLDIIDGLALSTSMVGTSAANAADVNSRGVGLFTLRPIQRGKAFPRASYVPIVDNIIGPPNHFVRTTDGTGRYADLRRTHTSICRWVMRVDRTVNRPNCRFQLDVDPLNNARGIITLIATVDILAGEELLYGINEDQPHMQVDPPIGIAEEKDVLSRNVLRTRVRPGEAIDEFAMVHNGVFKNDELQGAGMKDDAIPHRFYNPLVVF